MKRTLIVLLALCVGAGLWAQNVTLKMADPHPDRTNGWGAVIEQINAEFKAANPGVDIVTESYPDQPFQQKIKIYATARQLPDVFKYWSFSTLLKPLVDGGFVTELNKADFAQYGYVPGSLESNVWNGKLYGIPVSADFWVIYYNKKLFKDAGITAVPTTIEDLM
ncbi:MAG TPA: extracellular solute-binding protein, partial [Spirochaetia bacterium]|nr:extracellular solute-binding protein [Spirochaetia bacterium]